MPSMQNTRAELRQEIRDQVQSAVQAAQDAANQAGRATTGDKSQTAPVVAPAAPLPPISVGGGRLIIDKRDGQTVITSAALPPEILPLAQLAKETALGLLGLLAAIFILGPFARMFARRMDKRTDIRAAGEHSQMLSQQVLQLQQSMDGMALEMERISESQRFQSKLLSERRAD